MATPPFGMHNAGFIYQKFLESKLKRAAGGVLWLEYIDDVSIRVGSQDAPLKKSEWVAAAFIWLMTKSGEILNDKFFVFKDIITMLGVHFSLKNDRFAPKVNSYYKLVLHLAEMMRKPALKLKDLEILTGKVNWLAQDATSHSLAPIYKFIGLLKTKASPKNSLEHKALQNITVEWNRKLLEASFNALWEVDRAFSLFNKPNFNCNNNIAYIVCDANPMVAGAYITVGAATMEFEKIEPSNELCIPLKKIPKSYIQKFEIETLVHSTFAEASGLLKYIKLKFDVLQRLSKRVDAFVVLGDNLALIHKLQQQKSGGNILDYEINGILKIFERFNITTSYRWLRRSKKPIHLADSIGRIVCLSLNDRAIEAVENFFNVCVYTPKIFSDVFNIPLRLPSQLLTPLRNSRRVPLVCFPLEVDEEVFKIVTDCLRTAKLRVLIATPYFSRKLIHSRLLVTDAVSFPKIDKQYFAGVPTKPRRNFPFLVAFLKGI